MARCGARHTSARPIVGIGPKSGLPLPPWLPHPSSRTPDAQYCRRPRPDLPAPCSGRAVPSPSAPPAPVPGSRRAWAPRGGAHALRRPSSLARRLGGSPCPRLRAVPGCLAASPAPCSGAGTAGSPLSASPAPRSAAAACGLRYSLHSSLCPLPHFFVWYFI